MKINWCTCGQVLAEVWVLDNWGKKWFIRGYHCLRCGYSDLK